MEADEVPLPVRRATKRPLAAFYEALEHLGVGERGAQSSVSTAIQ